MKKLIITAAALMIAVATQAQGYFSFNTRAPNNIKFLDQQGNPLTGDNYFVQVFAGADVNSLAPVTDPSGILPLNQTGARAGYPNPTVQSVVVPGMGAVNAVIGYQAYQGAASGIGSATGLKSPLVAYANGLATGTTPLSVALVLAPTLPNEVALGTGNVALVPEPATLALGLLGLGALLAFRRRQ